MKKKQLGAAGEALAKEYLLNNGFEILAQNWRYGHGEIDIVAQQQQTIHFIEVKTRSTAHFGEPEISVSMAQQKKLAQTATAFLFAVNGAPQCQFDIIAIVGKPPQNFQLHYFPDAFFPFE